jgi:hypothetical protein
LFAEGQFRTLNATILLSAVLFGLVWIDVNPASDLVQIMAAMLTLLIVHINLQHFQDRTNPTPTLLSLGDWIRTLARESGPVRIGTIAIPEWISPRQRSDAVKLIHQTFDGKGYFAFRSKTKLAVCERISDSGPEGVPQLTLQTITGGAASSRDFFPAPMANGRDALERMSAAKWIPPIDDAAALPDDPEVLTSQFHTLFPDGIVCDLATREGQRSMRTLEKSTLSGILPMSIKSLEEGSTVVPLSGHWLTPIFHQERLRLIFVLPPESGREIISNWLGLVRAWHVGSQAMESASHDARTR